MSKKNHIQFKNKKTKQNKTTITPTAQEIKKRRKEKRRQHLGKGKKKE